MAITQYINDKVGFGSIQLYTLKFYCVCTLISVMKNTKIQVFQTIDK